MVAEVIDLLIGDVMKKTGLTRKALHYYESIGLIAPAVAENGYHVYTQSDVERLGIVAVLRQLDMPLETVDEFVKHPERAQALLTSYRKSLDSKQELLMRTIANVDALLACMEQGRPISLMTLPLQMLGDMLRTAFPGAFGQMLAEHFLPFLESDIDTPEKQEALQDMTAFLDSTAIELPDLLPEASAKHTTEMQAAYWKSIQELLSLPDEEKLKLVVRMRAQKMEMEDTISTAQPEVYRELLAKADALKTLLGASGYYEHVVVNLGIICPAYHLYLKEMEKLQRLLDGYDKTIC